MSPLAGLGGVGRLLTSGLRPWLQHVAPLGLKVVAHCRDAILGDRRRLVASLCRAGTCRGARGYVASGDATVRATGTSVRISANVRVVGLQVSRRQWGAGALARSVSGRREVEPPGNQLGLVAKELMWSHVHCSGVRGQKQADTRADFSRLTAGDCYAGVNGNSVAPYRA